MNIKEKSSSNKENLITKQSLFDLNYQYKTNKPTRIQLRISITIKLYYKSYNPVTYKKKTYPDNKKISNYE